MKALRIATRGSALALWQANHLRDALANSFDIDSEIVVVKTSGDRFATAQIEQIGIRGIFTKELEDTLIADRADLAVHSMKDVPTEFSEACKIAIIFPREDPRDALVSQNGESLKNLPQGARIGTSSLRRASQLRQFRPDFAIVEVRGNVDTRLRKVASGECEAMVLAKAGLDRLGVESRISEVLPPEIMLPAVGQGALGVEILAARKDEFPFLNELVDKETMRAVTAERTVLAALQGGCRLPLGAWGRFEGGELVLDSCVLSADGTKSVRGHGSALCDSIKDAQALGRAVATQLLDAGADRILKLAGRSVGQS
ncbi:MAG TPA: hydroxymethylbilane synthase [Terriglobales bacterium]|nr:hydroxymethylbilane synthase [Terriglobales bacterium]